MGLGGCGDDDNSVAPGADTGGGGSAPPLPTEPLAFTSRLADGQRDIFRINVDGSGLTNLTQNAAEDFSPAWSPDGSQLAFVSDRDGDDDIYVMDAGGSNVIKLTDGATRGYDPCWSPEGTRILFHSFRSGDQEVWVVNADGSDAQNVTNTPGSDGQPSWSPDGTRISFATSRHSLIFANVGCTR